MPQPKTSVAGDAELIAHLSIHLREDKPWAPRGHQVAWEQFVLQAGRAPSLASDRAMALPELAVDGPRQRTRLRAAAIELLFDDASGTLISYVVSGEERLAGPLGMNFWRPPVDNDRASGFVARSGVWRGAGSSAKVLDRELLQGANFVELHYALALAAGESRASLRWKLWGDGRLDVGLELIPDAKLGELPRVGMQCLLPASSDRWEWYGRGPHESYQDRKSGAWVGRFAGPVAELFHPYAEVQESGNRTDVRWAAFSDGAGSGLRFEALGELPGQPGQRQLLEVAAYPCLMSDLEGTRHPSEIPKRDVITVSIDLAQMGVAGDNSWGARPMAQYRLPTDRSYRYGFRISALLR